MNKILFGGLSALLTASSAYSGTVTTLHTERTPTFAEMQSEPALAGKVVHEFFVSSDADILSIDQVKVTGALFQAAAGGDSEPAIPPLVALIASLSADSWITTPGETAIAGGGFSNPNSSWFDTSNDGPVTHFMFARLTSNDLGSFTGRVNVAFNNSVESFPFHFVAFIPEPPALILGAPLLVAAFVFPRTKKLQTAQ